MDVLALLNSDPVTAARGLLGAHLTHAGVTVRLTEVEAYRGADDPASHAYRGETPRTAVMFGPAGHLYCYLSHGLHVCGNVVTGPAGEAAAVLLRAGEVVDGIQIARERRGPVADLKLASGPGNLMRALGIALAQNGTWLLGHGPVALEAGGAVNGAIRSGPRVGVSKGAEVAWRFWLDGERTVSAYRPGKKSPRHA